MRRRWRIAYGRLSQETHGFSPVLTEDVDFLHVHRGDDLAERCVRGRAELDGLVRNAELSGFVERLQRRAPGTEAVALSSAWAPPGGPIARSTYGRLRDQLLRELERAMPVDAVYLALHGAMSTEEHADGDADLLAAVRRIVGGDTVLAVSFDMHAQLSPELHALCDVLTAYRTNPHRDLAATGARVAELLVRRLRRGRPPCRTWRSLPIAFGGGTTVDFLSPMRRLLRRMRRVERLTDVESVDLLLGHPWTRRTAVGWSVCVATGESPALAEELADELAEATWRARSAPPPSTSSPSEAIDRVRRARWARTLGTVCLVDASDVVAAGGTGENTRLLAAILEHGADLRSFVPVRDAQVVGSLWDAAIGRPLTVELGGRLQPDVNSPLGVEAVLAGRCRTEHAGRGVHLRIGETSVVVTERAPLTLTPRFFRQFGLDPWRADLVVVKSFFHFRIGFAAVCRKSLLVRTRGITDLDHLARLDPERQVYPIHAVPDWRPADARVRAGPGSGA